MTWQEWVESEYNIIGAFIDKNNKVIEGCGANIIGPNKDTSGSMNVLASDIIKSNFAYWG